MLRLTIALTVLVAMFAASSELQAQRRTPIRNVFRQIGVGWNSGYHVQTPGPVNNTYSPWSTTNTPGQHWQNNDQPAPGQGSYFDRQSIEPGSPIGNSATRLLRDNIGNSSGYFSGAADRYRDAPSPANAAPDAAWQQNRQINRLLQPWESSNAHNSNAIIIQNDRNWTHRNSSGQFIPDSNPLPPQYEQQFRNSRPFNPGNR